jgi:hypothetical protein
VVQKSAALDRADLIVKGLKWESIWRDVHRVQLSRRCLCTAARTHSLLPLKALSKRLEISRNICSAVWQQPICTIGTCSAINIYAHCCYYTSRYKGFYSACVCTERKLLRPHRQNYIFFHGAAWNFYSEFGVATLLTVTLRSSVANEVTHIRYGCKTPCALAK